MARGRMISKSLSTSERFASLHREAGKLAEFCQSLYPLLVAHADDWGCQQGDVFTIKHLVHPTSPRKLEEFQKALMHLHNVSLIAWYQGEDGKWYVSIRGFAAHQSLKGHDKDRKRPIPGPPENLSKFSEVAQSGPHSPKLPLREENLREGKRREENSHVLSRRDADGTAEAGIDPDLKTDHVTNQHVSAFIRRFCELYSKYRHGAKHLVKREKHVPIVRLLLATYEPARLEKLAVVLLTTNDEWISGTDRGLGILSVKASWLDGLLAGYEAEHGPIQVAS